MVNTISQRQERGGTAGAPCCCCCRNQEPAHPSPKRCNCNSITAHFDCRGRSRLPSSLSLYRRRRHRLLGDVGGWWWTSLGGPMPTSLQFCRLRPPFFDPCLPQRCDGRGGLAAAAAAASILLIVYTARVVWGQETQWIKERRRIERRERTEREKSCTV